MQLLQIICTLFFQSGDSCFAVFSRPAEPSHVRGWRSAFQRSRGSLPFPPTGLFSGHRQAASSKPRAPALHVMAALPFTPLSIQQGAASWVWEVCCLLSVLGLRQRFCFTAVFAKSDFLHTFHVFVAFVEVVLLHGKCCIWGFFWFVNLQLP